MKTTTRLLALTALTAERDTTVSALVEDRDRIRNAAAEVEMRLSAEIAQLTALGTSADALVQRWHSDAGA